MWQASTVTACALQHTFSGARIVICSHCRALPAALPEVTYFQRGCTAMHRLLAVIDRWPAISAASGGEMPASVRGEVALQGVVFAYPTRPDLHVLKRRVLRDMLLRVR